MARYNNIKYRGFGSRRRFGVELEVNNTVDRSFIEHVIESCSDRDVRFDPWRQSRDNAFWHIKEDGTCGVIGCGEDKGWEVASYVGSGYGDVMHIATVAQTLAEAGIEANENCGFHIHVEVTDFTPSQMGVLLAHYNKAEYAILSALPQHRLSNPFCIPLHNILDYADLSIKRPMQLWRKLEPHKLGPHNNEYRYRSVNLVNYATGLKYKFWNRMTVEFRLPECSLLAEDVENWIKLFVNFVDWVKYQRMPKDLYTDSITESVAHLGLGHYGDTFSILSRRLLDTKTWLLERIVMFQEISNLSRPALLEARNLLNGMWSPIRIF